MDVNVLKKKSKKTKKNKDGRIENKAELLATFNKRRHALFRKASELSILTGAQIAILIRSPVDKNKIYSFGSSSVHDLLDRFVAEGGLSSSERQLEGSTKNEEVNAQEGRQWWDKPIESMDLEELEKYAQDLERTLAANPHMQLEGSSKNEEVKEGQKRWEKPIDSMDLKELEQHALDLDKMAADLGSD